MPRGVPPPRSLTRGAAQSNSTRGATADPIARARKGPSTADNAEMPQERGSPIQELKARDSTLTYGRMIVEALRCASFNFAFLESPFFPSIGAALLIVQQLRLWELS